jgi:hypothetical protein
MDKTFVLKKKKKKPFLASCTAFLMPNFPLSIYHESILLTDKPSVGMGIGKERFRTLGH